MSAADLLAELRVCLFGRGLGVVIEGREDFVLISRTFSVYATLRRQASEARLR